jgi:heterodisulfide reductase subunit A-like polyferredoxin
VAKITEDSASGDLEVKAEDSLSGEFLIKKVRLVVLASGMVRAAPKVQVEIDGGLQKDEHGFLTADQPSRGLPDASNALSTWRRVSRTPQAPP